ncbi:hypothetical protein [Variovorax rhizosphaerae]|uniref:Uncharacterized protein n=1 Tax=Variovorax rhizosphaerae TaxID=1836200 RepID=A0ABU8WUC6_9BURK
MPLQRAGARQFRNRGGRLRVLAGRLLRESDAYAELRKRYCPAWRRKLVQRRDAT